MKNIHQIREVSTLSFNERVLQEAEDGENPLMERLRFLGIFSSNMDEFFKVRVASIHRRVELGKRSMDQVLDVIIGKTRELDERFRAAYGEIIEAMAADGIRLIQAEDLDKIDEETEAWLRAYFKSEVLPSLVPIILNRRLPFPQLTDGSLFFGIQMNTAKPRYAILEIPQDLPRFVPLPNESTLYIDDVIRFFLNDIFYIFEYDSIEAFEFKISRDAELDIDNDFSEGYVRKMERVLRQRKGGRPTRLVYDEAMPSPLLQILIKELRISEHDTLIPGGRYHNMKDLMRFPDKRPEHLFTPIEPAHHPVLDRGRTPMLDIIKNRDLMVTYPYQSFDHLIRLLREAAIDPKVEEISMTLYRAAKNSQVVNALVNGARNGKKIFVSIELQARFDEENNIAIAGRLTEAGATVVYGVPPMKVHSKLIHIKRRTGQFAALSTGNFNEVTGELYVDSVLMTADNRIASEVATVFRFLGEAAKVRVPSTPKFKQLLVSPFNARAGFMKLLGREKAKGEDGYIFIKVNHLTDPKIIKRIREAADAGVKMDLVVRTTYAVTPHKNIRPISILDRFLEHQRVFIFGTGKDRMVYMSSADLMERNLDWRVEVAFPVLDPQLQQEVCDMMALQVQDTSKARILDATQSNPYVCDDLGGLRAQQATYAYVQQLNDTPDGATERTDAGVKRTSGNGVERRRTRKGKPANS